MSVIKCFMIEPTGREARWLRRYSSGSECAVSGSAYHNALVRIEDGPVTHRAEGKVEDSRWPTKCVCGYEFKESDEWQVFPLSIFMTPDGIECSLHRDVVGDLRSAPPGAMWLVDWCPGRKKHDGPYLWCQTPDGSWCIDGGSNNGDGWTRTGDPPNVTAHPSIICGSYHGWLGNGELVEC